MSPFVHLMRFDVPGDSEDTWSERTHAPCVHGSAAHSSRDLEATYTSPTDEWAKKMWDIYTGQYFSASERMKQCPMQQHWWTWRVSYWTTYVRRRSRNTFWGPSHSESKTSWYKCSYLQTRKRLTDLENEFMVAGGKDEGEGIVRESGINMYTLIYLKWITSKDLLYST